MAEDMYIDPRGLCYCSAHRREVCQICCVDHRITNDITRAGDNPDMDAIYDNHLRVQTAEHQAMATRHSMEGRLGPVVLGTVEAQQLFDAAAAAPPSGQKRCTLCGVEGNVLRCAQCSSAWYCSKEHQRADWSRHKAECRRVAAAAGATTAPTPGASQRGTTLAPPPQQPTGEPISWRKLQALNGYTATGKVLEVRVISQPISFLRWACDCKDRKGDVRRIAFYTDVAPAGLALGKVLRWRNPRYYTFLDGSSGARIEDDDLSDITVSDV